MRDSPRASTAPLAILFGCILATAADLVLAYSTLARLNGVEVAGKTGSAAAPMAQGPPGLRASHRTATRTWQWQSCCTGIRAGRKQLERAAGFTCNPRPRCETGVRSIGRCTTSYGTGWWNRKRHPGFRSGFAKAWPNLTAPGAESGAVHSVGCRTATWPIRRNVMTRLR